jgi:disulfide bond formation protein DsbB
MFKKHHQIQFNYLFLLCILVAIAFVLTAAFYMQIFFNEIPCPLCLLQRLAFFGIAFGIILNLRIGYSIRHEGLTLISIIFLLIISTRQTLLDIYPRAGHQYIGTAILGLHMPVWSIVISVLLLFAYALRFTILGYADFHRDANIELYPKIKTIASIFIWYIIFLCALNLLSSFLQCGFGSCHTSGYRF